MGQVFYDMGFLSGTDVIDCSASDLVGQYVGHTGPKAKAQLEKALGKVLFIDEAYRLAEGGFATEAINELVDQLTKPQFKGRLIVILAGYDKDINNLIAMNPGLSSRFPEEVIFCNMSPAHCMQLLEQELRQKHIELPSMADERSSKRDELVEILEELASLPSWGNARDIQTMAKTLTGLVFKTQRSPTDPLRLSWEDITSCAKILLVDRRSRINQTTNRDSLSNLPTLTQDLPPIAPRQETNATAGEAEQPIVYEKPQSSSPVPQDQQAATRDDGVPEAVWQQLQADKQAQEHTLKLRASQLKAQEDSLRLLQEKEAQAIAQLEKLSASEATDQAEMMELKRRDEEARLQEQNARTEREKALVELERIRAEEERRKKQEARVQRKLKEMGVCPVGYRWIKQSSGYTCAGGSHFVSDAALGI